MKQLIKKAKSIIERGLIEPSEEGYYDIDGEVVRKIKKHGRTLISCTCASCSRFCKEPNICSRKIAVILFEAQDLKFKQKIRESLEYFEQCKKLKMTPEADYGINLMKDLRRFIL